MIYPGLVKKELMENRWKIGIAFIILAAFGATMQISFQWLGKMMTDIPGLEGELVRQLMGEMMDDYQLFVWANWYGKTFYQGLVLVAIILGVSPLAGEVSSRTAHFTFTLPMSRATIYWSKYLAGVLALATIVVGTTLITFLVSQLWEVALKPVFLAGIPLALAGSIVIYSLTMVFSAFLDDQIKVAVAASITAFVISLPGWIGAISHFSIYVQMRGWQVYLGQGSGVTPTIVMLVLSGLLAWSGLKVVEGKEY